MEGTQPIKTVTDFSASPEYSAVIFSFNGDQENLVPLLLQIKKHVFGYKEIIVVWDDFVRQAPIDFDDVKAQANCDFRVVYQSEIYDWPTAMGEWGWIKQQLAKLLCYTYVSTPYAWICDGDIAIIKNLVLFSSDNRPLIREWNRLISINIGYYDAIDKLFGIKAQPFVLMNGGGNGVFDHKILLDMFQHCEQRNGMDLVQCVNSIILPGGPDKNRHNLWPFSEFETYSNFAVKHHRERFVIAPWNWEDHSKWPNISADTQILI